MVSWIPAYNTNGFSHHRLEDALVILAELGYGGVALTLDVHHLDPWAPDHSHQVEALGRLLEDLKLKVVVESGARFNLDMRRKHYPSLLCREDGLRRVDYLRRCHDVACALGADCVSLWSGHNFEGLSQGEAEQLLGERLQGLMESCAGSGVRWAMEPEPGMFLETVDQYEGLSGMLPDLHLALDLGHLMVTGERRPEEAIREFAPRLATVAIEDMKKGVHEHLPLGEGDMEFAPIFEALREVNYQGLLSVELPRSSATAPAMAATAMAFLASFTSPA